jgi:hypothetical protein
MSLSKKFSRAKWIKQRTASFRDRSGNLLDPTDFYDPVQDSHTALHLLSSLSDSKLSLSLTNDLIDTNNELVKQVAEKDSTIVELKLKLHKLQHETKEERFKTEVFRAGCSYFVKKATEEDIVEAFRLKECKRNRE